MFIFLVSVLTKRHPWGAPFLRQSLEVLAWDATDCTSSQTTDGGCGPQMMHSAAVYMNASAPNSDAWICHSAGVTGAVLCHR